MKRQGYHRLAEILGWYGVAAVLVAYAAISLGWLSREHTFYHILNATGGAGILIDAWFDRNYQPVVLNAIWVIVALIALAQIVL
ncbi:hypothetical protein HZA85_04195 [Candidatus Uhrbacteria bacterium]|nr:hypothetical protein [Candidatus Uhrbacteria bacterium]